MDAQGERSPAVRTAIVVTSSVGLGIVGRILRDLLPAALGQAVEMLFDVLAGGILASGLSDLYFPTRLLPEMLVLRRWLWLCVAMGFATIRYLQESGDFGPGKLITSVAIGLGVATFAAWWIVAARRQHILLTSKRPE
jgi:hypothetical protein